MDTQLLLPTHAGLIVELVQLVSDANATMHFVIDGGLITGMTRVSAGANTRVMRKYGTASKP
ncbi:MAG: hypothetical protein JOZ65_21055 [Chloroflexi bacterium]|nr:hypothetical protein [Chloroflexota bacterium]